MRNREVFVLGAVLGAAVVWLWGRQIGEYAQETTHGMRMKAAEGVRAVEEKAGKLLDGGGDALHRVDDFLQDTKEHVGEALRAGRAALGAAPAPSKRQERS